MVSSEALAEEDQDTRIDSAPSYGWQATPDMLGQGSERSGERRMVTFGP